MKHLIAFLTCLAAPVAAQELTFDISATMDCFDRGGGYDQCVGESAQACMTNTPGGYATVIVGACFDAEWQAWDADLNRTYQALMAQAREMDAENGDYAPSQAEALREMQRKWIPFRDAKCGYVASTWGGGTGAGPASIECVMKETARQVQFLESMASRG